MPRGIMGLITRKAPDFPRSAAWMNVRSPLTLGELKGRIVILYFAPLRPGAAGIGPAIAEVKRRYGGEPVTAISVCPAAPAKSRAHRGPVVLDGSGKLRKLYGVNEWPAVVIIGATGMMDYKVSGELTAEQLYGLVGDSISKAREADSLTGRH